MDRRAFIALVGGSMLAGPLAEAQQQVEKVSIGYLSGNPPSDTQDAIDAFNTRLRNHGYLDGQNLRVEYRYADGNYDRLPQLVAGLVRRNVDVIFAFGTPGARAAKKATSSVATGGDDWPPCVVGGAHQDAGATKMGRIRIHEVPESAMKLYRSVFRRRVAG